jgi:hypothetical protein
MKNLIPRGSKRTPGKWNNKTAERKKRKDKRKRQQLVTTCLRASLVLEVTFSNTEARAFPTNGGEKDHHGCMNRGKEPVDCGPR